MAMNVLKYRSQECGLNKIDRISNIFHRGQKTD